MKKEEYIFYEEQKIPLIAKVIAVVSCAAIMTVLIASTIHSSDTSEKKSTLILTVVNCIILGIAAISILYTKLIVRIDKKSINIRFFPFMIKDKKLPLKDIQRYYIRKYRPIMEYGGWGIKWNSNGRAYCIRGNMAIQLEFESGSKILIGTQKPGELNAAMDKGKL